MKDLGRMNLATHEKSKRPVTPEQWESLFAWAEQPRPDTEIWFISGSAFAPINGIQLAPAFRRKDEKTNMETEIGELFYGFSEPHIAGLFGCFEGFFPRWTDLSMPGSERSTSVEVRLTLRDFQKYILPKRAWREFEGWFKFAKGAILGAIPKDKSEKLASLRDGKNPKALIDLVPAEVAEGMVIRKGFYALDDVFMMMGQFRENAIKVNSYRDYMPGEQFRLTLHGRLDAERSRIEREKEIQARMRKQSAEAVASGRPDLMLALSRG